MSYQTRQVLLLQSQHWPSVSSCALHSGYCFFSPYSPSPISLYFCRTSIFLKLIPVVVEMHLLLEFYENRFHFHKNCGGVCGFAGHRNWSLRNCARSQHVEQWRHCGSVDEKVQRECGIFGLRTELKRKWLAHHQSHACEGSSRVVRHSLLGGFVKSSVICWRMIVLTGACSACIVLAIPRLLTWSLVTLVPGQIHVHSLDSRPQRFFL